MRRLSCLLLVMCMLCLGLGCASNKVIKGVEYNTYGIIDAPENKNPNIHYDLVWGNIIWGTLLLPTIICPIYFWGFSIWEPVGEETGVPGQVMN